MFVFIIFCIFLYMVFWEMKGRGYGFVWIGLFVVNLMLWIFKVVILGIFDKIFLKLLSNVCILVFFFLESLLFIVIFLVFFVFFCFGELYSLFFLLFLLLVRFMIVIFVIFKIFVLFLLFLLMYNFNMFVWNVLVLLFMLIL